MTLFCNYYHQNELFVRVKHRLAKYGNNSDLLKKKILYLHVNKVGIYVVCGIPKDTNTLQEFNGRT